MDYKQWQIRSELFDFALWYGLRKMTPVEITKLTDQAKRAKRLLERSATASEHARVVNDRYEGTLSTFEAHVDRVSKEDAALTSVLAAMGNAGPILEEAFQDGKVSTHPEEVAHLPKADGKAA